MFSFLKKEGLDKEALKADVIKALCKVFDPEIPVNIYDLGLIYDVIIDDDANVDVKMTLTTPGCPVAQTFPGTVEQAVNSVEGVNDCIVELVWDPPWTQERMTEAAKLELGLFY
jgi:FeS assembly SUF system protein